MPEIVRQMLVTAMVFGVFLALITAASYPDYERDKPAWRKSMKIMWAIYLSIFGPFFVRVWLFALAS